jgi:hypothetical protein
MSETNPREMKSVVREGRNKCIMEARAAPATHAAAMARRPRKVGKCSLQKKTCGSTACASGRSHQRGMRQTAAQLCLRRTLHWQWPTAIIPPAHEHIALSISIIPNHPRPVEVQKQGPPSRWNLGPQVRHPLPAGNCLGEAFRKGSGRNLDAPYTHPSPKSTPYP